MRNTEGSVSGTTGKLETEKPHPPACQKREADAYLRTEGSKDGPPSRPHLSLCPPRLCAASHKLMSRRHK